jgi:hypothetical protein
VSSIPAHALTDVLARAPDLARPFVNQARTRLQAIDGDRVRLNLLPHPDNLRRIYALRRDHLARRGVDVRGLDALLEALGTMPTAACVECFVLEGDQANVIGFLDDTCQSLVGWVLVPSHLARLSTFDVTSPRPR